MRPAIWGIPMNYHVSAAVLLFAAFIVLTVLVQSNYDLKQWDYEIFKKINITHGNFIDSVMFAFSAYGREVVWIGVLVGLFAFGKVQGRRVSILLLITFLILIPAGAIIKDIIDRPRPNPTFINLLLTTEHHDPSFPSGHALITSAGALIMLTSYISGRQKILSIILGFEALLVGYSLIDVGAHYLLDVLGGCLLGTATSLVIVGNQNRLESLFQFVESVKNKIR